MNPVSDILNGPKARLLVVLGIVLFAGFLLTSTISYLVSRGSIRTSILQNELPLSSNNVYSEIQHDLLEPILISSLMANDTFAKDWVAGGEKDSAQIIDYLSHIKKKYGTITAFLVSENTRRYYNAESVLKTVSETDPADAWFFRVRKMKGDYEINVDPDMSNDNAMAIFINYRIVGKDGAFLAATGVGLSVNSVKTLMQQYHNRFHRDVYFYDRNGRLLLHSLGAAHTSERENNETVREMLAKIDAGETNITSSVVGRDGTLSNYRYIPELNWILVVEQVSDGTRAILFKTFALNLFVCIGITVLLLSVFRHTVIRYQDDLEVQNRKLEGQSLALARANAAREKLFSIIGHDLRAPIDNIRITLTLLDEGAIGPEKFIEFQNHLRGAVDHVLVASENLMQWGMIQSGSLGVRARHLSLRQMAQEGVQSLSFLAKEKEITIENNIPAQAAVLADLPQIQCVLRNLLSNSIKFTAKDGRIALTAERRVEHWCVGISDNGIGMDAGRLNAILAGDADGGSTLGTAGERGFGLGLQLCIDFIRANKGSLSAESVPGKGTTFFFTLPASERFF